MNKTVIALIAGIILGAAGTWLVSRAPGASDAPGQSTRLATATLPDLPQPYYRVLFENEAVRIVDHILEPGGAEPQHTHPPMLAYFVQGATVVVTEADGSTAEISIPTGAFLGADNLRWWTHALENTGTTPLHSVLVELKGHPRSSEQ